MTPQERARKAVADAVAETRKTALDMPSIYGTYTEKRCLLLTMLTGSLRGYTEHHTDAELGAFTRALLDELAKPEHELVEGAVRS